MCHFLPFGDWLPLKKVLSVCSVGTWHCGGTGGGMSSTVREGGSQIEEVLAVCFAGTWYRGGSGGGVSSTVREDGSQIIA